MNKGYVLPPLDSRLALSNNPSRRPIGTAPRTGVGSLQSVSSPRTLVGGSTLKCLWVFHGIHFAHATLCGLLMGRP